MKRKKIQVLVLLGMVCVMASVSIRAEDSPSAATPAADSAKPKTPKRHHKHKKPAPPTPPASPAKTPPAVSDISPKAPESIGVNDNAGAPNMGPGDHVPGTTGTSGQ